MLNIVDMNDPEFNRKDEVFPSLKEKSANDYT